MKYFFLFFLWVLIGITGISYAESLAEAPSVSTIPSLLASQASWAFFGTVMNENNEEFAFFFQVQRSNHQLSGVALLVDYAKKTVLIYEEGHAIIDNAELDRWKLGNLFLRFNPINSSWVFGVRDNDKKGFNFKVDMLSVVNHAKTQSIYKGVYSSINHTQRLNGHFQIQEGKEQFVTAKQVWLRQIWLGKVQDHLPLLSSGLCQFNNNSLLYFVSLLNLEKTQNILAGWINKDNDSRTKANLITVKQEDNYHITVQRPTSKVTFSILNLLPPDNSLQLIAGITLDKNPGFCIISRHQFST